MNAAAPDPVTLSGVKMHIHKPSLTLQILLALAAGALVGSIWPSIGQSLQILATIFIRLVLVIIAPLIFASLAAGIAGQGDLRKLGSVALQALAYFMSITAFALAAGMALGLLLRPGFGLTLALKPSPELVVPPAGSFWVRIFPQSIFDAMARGDVLQIVIFALIFGMAVNLAGRSGYAIRDWCDALAQVMYKFTDLIMRVAPAGVFGAASAVASRQGLDLGVSFVRLIVAVYLGLALLLFLVFPLLAVAFRISLRGFCQAVKEPFAIALATSSASAALPKAMENIERMGVPRSIVAFVLPIGLSLNPAGTALFVGAAALFVIEASGLQTGQAGLWTLFGALYLASKGIAGVPRFGLVVAAAGLSSIGVPSDIVGAGIGVLLGIDPLLDMPRTAVNITGNCLAAAIVARWQGCLQSPVPSEPKSQAEISTPA
jgi:proton glutamate symport protein